MIIELENSNYSIVGNLLSIFVSQNEIKWFNNIESEILNNNFLLIQFKNYDYIYYYFKDIIIDCIKYNNDKMLCNIYISFIFKDKKEINFKEFLTQKRIIKINKIFK